ncbi:MAG: hypothetical protein HY013_21480 [Candidatus Solibacter usitatus]|nr:hypothetical protein [Candidatus Solibacter usitatus]
MSPMRIADSLEAEPIRLSIAALEWLAEGGHLPLTPASPLAFLLGAARQTAAEEQAAAGRDLHSRGIRFGVTGRPAGQDPSGSLFRNAIEIVAAPEAVLRISIAAPPQPAVLLQLFLGKGRAALAFSGHDSLHVGAAMPVESLAAALTRKLEGAPPSPDLEEIRMWPSQVKVCSLVWSGSPDQSAGRPVSRTKAVAALEQGGVSASAAGEVLSGLCEAGIVEERKGLVSLQHPYEHWMPLIWSGHLFQLERIAFGDSPAPVPRMLFTGPPGSRALSQDLTGDELREELAAEGDLVESAEESLLVLTHLDRDILADAVRGILNLTA